jgi:hypothetical protein
MHFFYKTGLYSFLVISINHLDKLYTYNNSNAYNSYQSKLTYSREIFVVIIDSITN